MMLLRLILIMAELTKDKIMLTANDLFLQDGVREVSIDDICRKLCISKKTFYQFYATKEDLVADVVTNDVEKKKNEFRKLVEGKDVVQILKALFLLVNKKKTVDKDKRIAKEIMKYYPETFVRHLEDRNKAMHRFFVDNFREGMKQGLVRLDMDSDAMQFLVCAMHERIVDYLNGDYHVEGAKLSFKSLAAALEDIVTRSLLTPKGFEEYKSLDNDNNS